VRTSKDRSFIVYPRSRFEVDRSKTLPAGERPRSQGMMFCEAAFRELGSATETAHRIAPKAYHTSPEHSLVVQDLELLNWPTRDWVESARPAASCRFRHANSDAVRAIVDASGAYKM